jgi:carbamoyltransferase
MKWMAPVVAIGLAAALAVGGSAAAKPRPAPALTLEILDHAKLDKRTGVPVCVNTSLNTAGRPMVDDPRDALECFGSAPVDLLVLGPFLVRRRR